MRISVFEADMIIEALSRRAARYDCMADEEGISLRAEHRYQIRADVMRSLRDKLTALKAECKPMALDVG